MKYPRCKNSSAKVVAVFMVKKETSYQKLKRQNKELHDKIENLHIKYLRDIRKLIENKPDTDTIILKTTYKLQFQVSDAAWSGNTTASANKTFKGFTP